MRRLGFSEDFIGILISLYDGDGFFCEAGDMRSDVIYPRRGLKQGCSLSPALFSLYILDLGERLAAVPVGVPVEGGVPVVRGVGLDGLVGRARCGQEDPLALGPPNRGRTCPSCVPRVRC